MYTFESIQSEILCHLVRHLPSKASQRPDDDDEPAQQLHVTKRVNVYANAPGAHHRPLKRPSHSQKNTPQKTKNPRFQFHPINH